MVLLGDVRELEEERERPLHGRLALEPEPGDRVTEPGPRAALARSPGQRPHALLVVQQRLPLLLDEHAAEHIAEQPDIGPKCGVGGHGAPTLLARFSSRSRCAPGGCRR